MIYLHFTCTASQVLDYQFERVKGIEPSSQAWEAHILPLNHTRNDSTISSNFSRRVQQECGHEGPEGPEEESSMRSAQGATPPGSEAAWKPRLVLHHPGDAVDH